MGRRKESGSAFAFELQPSHARGLSPLPGPFYLTSCGGKRSTGSTIRKTTGREKTDFCRGRESVVRREREGQGASNAIVNEC